MSVATVTLSAGAVAQEAPVKRSGEEFVICSVVELETRRLGGEEFVNVESSLRSATILMAAAYETGLYVAPEHLEQELERVYLAKQLEIVALPEAKRAESLADRYPQCESTLKSAWELLVPLLEPAVRMNSQGRK